MDKIRIGVFGARRGGSYVSLLAKEKEDIEIVAVCDKDIDSLSLKTKFPDLTYFKDFDEFMTYGKEHGMNAVFLANYFYDHARYAIRAMEAGMNVISECTAAGTLKECVDLVEAAERTGMKYMMAENYPFSANTLEMRRVIQNGELGSLLYAEGEYNHSGPKEDLINLTASSPYHWRAYLPRTYYSTHALGPLMYMTDSVPTYVSARAARSELLYEIREHRHNFDGTGILFCEMSNGMVARFTGCTAMASDYSRYRMVGDRASLECGGNIGDGRVRKMYFAHTKPENEPQNCVYSVSQSSFGPKGVKANGAGHGGGDSWVVSNMIDYFLHDADPFFDVYRSAAMSATAILAWRSALSHGENYKVPDFRCKAERNLVREDALTPFPDDEGNGASLPAAVPAE